MFTPRYSASVSTNHVRLTNAGNGDTCAGLSSHPFSSDERLIANYEAAFAFVGELIRALEPRHRRLFIFPTVEVSFGREPSNQQDVDDVRRLFEEQGFARVKIT